MPNEPKGKQPVMSGQVQDDNRTKIGDLALWENESKTPKAPEYTGLLTKEDGTKFRVSLWIRGKEKTTSQSSL